MKQTTPASYKKDHPFLKEVDSLALANAQLHLEAAFKKTFNELKPFDGFAGAIAIDKQGTIFHQDSHPSMVFASFDGENEEVFN